PSPVLSANGRRPVPAPELKSWDKTNESRGSTMDNWPSAKLCSRFPYWRKAAKCCLMSMSRCSCQFGEVSDWSTLNTFDSMSSSAEAALNCVTMSSTFKEPRLTELLEKGPTEKPCFG